MEPITHVLTGAALGRSGFNRLTAYATATMALAAEAPDIDIVLNAFGPVTAFAHHRGFTHTFLGTPVMAAAVVGLIFLYHRWRISRGKKPELPARWGLLFLLGWLAALSHILLDFTNNYGVRPFSPFLHRWYSWDIVFIIEPVMWAALGFAVVWPLLSRLVGAEVSSGKRAKFAPRWPAVAALVIIALMWAVRDVQHARAVTILGDLTFQGERPLRVGAYPFPITPYRWNGVVETESAFHLIDMRLGDNDPVGEQRVRYKPEETEVTLAAKRSRMGQVYLDWAAHPFVEVQRRPEPEGGYVVRMWDLRFEFVRFDLFQRDGHPLEAVIILDEDLNVVAQGMGERME